jgi:hypothetical protein
MSSEILVPLIALGFEDGSPIKWLFHEVMVVDPSVKLSACDEHIVERLTATQQMITPPIIKEISYYEVSFL